MMSATQQQHAYEMLAGCTPYPTDFAERYRAEGYWTNDTLPDMLRRTAVNFGERTAIVDHQQRWSYYEFWQRTEQLAAGFASLGIQHNDRVVVQLPNIAEFYAVVFALFRLGALPIFALPAHRSAEIGYFIGFSEAVAYVVADRFAGFDYRNLAQQMQDEHATLQHVVVLGDAGPFTPLKSLYQMPIDLPKPHPNNVAFFQLSGGSTGVPKLIPRTHDDYLYSVRGSNEICHMTEESVYLCALPAAHNFPMSSPGSFGAFMAGATVVLSLYPSPDVVFPLIERERVTITGIVPPLAMVWMDAAANTSHDLSSLQVLLVGGAKFGSEAAARVRPTLGCQLQQVFGMAEGLVNYTRLDDGDELVLHTQGRPISPADEVRVVDDDDQDLPNGTAGHLLVRGPYTIRGYYRATEHNASAFTPDGFYRTGDIVVRNDQGYLTVVGRAKEQINRGGDKVAAEEIENHLLAHPLVQDVAIVAIPDAYLGERTCAFVILRETLRASELARFLRTRGVADYKVPDRFEFVSEFPHTGVGKISKRELRRLLSEQLSNKQ
jgi:2,3-dihydroxybenzoate-AMP ligase